MKPLELAGLLLGMFVLPASAARGQTKPPVVGIPGVAYTLTVRSAPKAGTSVPALSAGPSQNYVGRSVFAADRGRMDIVQGGVPPLFTAGDYVLFDTTGFLVVHPATRDFIAITRDAGGPSADRLAQAGVDIKLSDVKVTLDSLGPSDTVAGYATVHYRMTSAFNMSIEASFMAQQLGAEAVTDYWVAFVPGLPNNPLLRANGVMSLQTMGSAFADLSRRVDSASARMHQAVALRSTTTSRLVQGPGESGAVESTSEVSNLANAPVDENLLIIPAGFTQKPIPGFEAMPLPDIAAKWRRRPGAPP